MKRIYLLGITVLLLGQIVYADSTFVSGAVEGEWTREGSPYIVQGDLTVGAGDTLAIGPGVRVFFEGAYKLITDSAAVFSAVATAQDSIVLTGAATPAFLRWGGILCKRSADTVRIKYCQFENATGLLNGEEAYAAVSVHKSNLVVEHCTFRNNEGVVPGGDAHGGALFVSDYSYLGVTTEIRDCLFEENSANHGGAVALHTVSGIMERCVYRNNHATSGGAIFSFYDGMQIQDCEFVENRAEGDRDARGGAIWYEINLGTVEDCVFLGNHSDAMGGAIADLYGNTSTVTRYEGNHFLNNSADSIGGALAINGRALLKKCLIEGNSAPEGGGLYQVNAEQLTITQCTFVRNSGSISGAAIWKNEQSLNIFNSALAYNTGTSTINRPNCTNNTYRNNAFWGNTEPLYDVDPCGDRHVANRMNNNGDVCDVDFNLYLDPHFVPWERYNYNLTETSPLIDAGVAASIFETTNDPDGTVPDIGAFFFNQTPSASEEPVEIAKTLSLSQNYPNPFNAETIIEFEVPQETRATLDLFDITGRHVRTLFDDLASGRNSVHVSMNGLASGIYIYRLNASGYALSHKMLLIR